MYLAFIDDSVQRGPTRDGMRPLVAAGCVVVNIDAVQPLISALDNLCRDRGFPPGDEFKWSPNRGAWMYASLRGSDRTNFFRDVLAAGVEHEVTGIVCVSETATLPATNDAESAFQDAVTLLLERVNKYAQEMRSNAIVVADRPGGGSRQAAAFIEACGSVLRGGTNYSEFDHIPMNVVTTDSQYNRLVQLADVVTSCTTAFVGGEPDYSAAVFEFIKPMLRHNMGRIGGRGLKLHPDFRLMNLYHWLVGDTHTGEGLPLPMADRLYAESASLARP